MPANVVAQIQIDDSAEYQPYLDGFLPSFERHGGELLASSMRDTEVIEGEWAYPRTVLLKFPSREAAHSWYHDPEYQALVVHRHRAARTNLVIMGGETTTKKGGGSG
jgi:uncharacterized protein (DUF1330 family)